MEIKVKIEYSKKIEEDRVLDINDLKRHFEESDFIIEDDSDIHSIIIDYLEENIYDEFQNYDFDILDSNMDELIEYFSYLITPKEEKSRKVCPCCNQMID